MKEENRVYILIAVDVQNQMEGGGEIPNKHLGELVRQTFQLRNQIFMIHAAVVSIKNDYCWRSYCFSPGL